MSKLVAKMDEPMLQEPAAADRPTVPTAPNPTTAEGGLAQKNPALNTALDTVPADRLRDIIKKLCLISDTAEEHISQLLLTPEENVNPTSKRKRSTADENIEAGNSSKRMKSHYAMCEQCENDFDVTQNHRKACRYHPCQSKIQPCIVTSGLTNSPERVGDRDGDSEPDVREFTGQYGGMYGLEKKYRESYRWSCCGRAGYKGGCRRGPHRDDSADDDSDDEYVPSDTDLEDSEDGNNSKDGGE